MEQQTGAERGAEGAVELAEWYFYLVFFDSARLRPERRVATGRKAPKAKIAQTKGTKRRVKKRKKKHPYLGTFSWANQNF